MSTLVNTNFPEVYIIGSNFDGQAGLGHSKSIQQLTQIKTNKLITSIYPSSEYVIYTDDEFNNIFVAGYNNYGQLGINTFGENITTLTPLTYFKDNNIRIKQIFVSIASYTTFFMTTDDKIYGCGKNIDGNLGLENETEHENFDTRSYLQKQHQPVLISQLKDVIEIRPSDRFSIALCLSDNTKLNTIIHHWCRLYSIASEIISLLFMFTKYSKVYSTVYGNKDNKKTDHSKYGWREIETLSDKNIIKIAAGDSHSLFLGPDGVVYSCGNNVDGQCGLRKTIERKKIPTPIKYFIRNGIKIVDISAGSYHSLVLDNKGRIYSFGYNKVGQCSDGYRDRVYIPQMIEYLKKYVIVEIKCGFHTSYCKTECDKNFLWGSNRDNQCMDFSNVSKVIVPNQIDEIVRAGCNCKSISKVFPGGFFTLIIV